MGWQEHADTILRAGLTGKRRHDLIASQSGPYTSAIEVGRLIRHRTLPGSAAGLEELVRSNLLLVPLDRRGEWYRYHHLFRDMLLAELQRREPGLMPVLRRRAAAWCRWEGLPEEAWEYSIAAGDVDAAAELVEKRWLPTLWQGGMPEVRAIARCELLAMAGSHWERAESLAGEARDVLRAAGAEESFATPLVCVVRARTALHRGDVPAARRELVSAQRLRPLLTYALPHLAVQARIELTHAHVALGDLAGARTLMGEIDELLTRRPGLGTLVHDAEALRDQLAKQWGSTTPGASSLTDAELRLLPLLTTYLPFGEIAAELSLSTHTIKTQARSIYRKLGASTRSQAVTHARELGLLDA
jgi:ATP/maltotriose-dependent transcriptional regulator MalT